MEILVRWKCPHLSTASGCSACDGRGYLERWITLDMIPTLPNASWIILARRPGHTPVR